MNFPFFKKRGKIPEGLQPLVILENSNFGDPHFSEQIRALRARCEQKMESLQWKIVAVTSSVAGEGKSLASSNLAANLSTDGRKKVLLLDMDLRNSDLARKLKLSPTPGLSEFLSGAASFQDVIQNSLFNNLYVIPSGTRIPNPIELFTGNTFKNFFMHIRGQFDYIVVDTPPVVPVADALVLRDFVDGFIMVIRSDFTPFNIFRQAVDEIGEKQILGVIINGVKLENNRYYKRYYGKYYKSPVEKR